MALDLKGLANQVRQSTPQGRTRTRGQAVAGGTGPVRQKKSPNLGQAIIGVFIGILLVLGSPIAMWQAQSQTRAKDFQSAQPVTNDSKAVGYVLFSGQPAYAPGETGADCHFEDCIYERARFEELVTRTELICAERVEEDEYTRVLRQNGSECDEDGNCVPCWDVEKDEWEERRAETVTNAVTIGTFTVHPTAGAIYLDTQDDIVDTGFDPDTLNDTRTVYESFTMPTTLLVAGDSNGEVVSEGEKTFVLSQYSEAATLEKLKEMDRTSRIVLWIVTFLMLFVGFSLILGPLSWAGRQLRFIPVIGPMLKDVSGAVIAGVSFVLAIPVWVIIFVFVGLLKLWWLGLIVAALLIGLIVWKVLQGGKK